VRWAIDLSGGVVPRPHSVFPITTEGEAWRVRDDGSVVGWFRSGGNAHAFLWTPGGAGAVPPNPQLIDLGTLGGARSVAFGVANGTVVGASDTAIGESHAFVWRMGGTDGVALNPQMKDLSRPPEVESAALDVNESGLIVGWTRYSGGESSAVLWDAGTEHDLEYALSNHLGPLVLPLSGGLTLTRANAINNAGQITGLAVDPNGAPRAWLGQFTPALGAFVNSGHPYSDFARIIGQVVAGGGGISIGPGGHPIRVPPPHPEFLATAVAATLLTAASPGRELSEQDIRRLRHALRTVDVPHKE